MAKYKVILKTGAYAHLIVEADNPIDAEDLAFDEAPTICAQCSGWNHEYSLELGEEWEVNEAIELDDESDDE